MSSVASKSFSRQDLTVTTPTHDPIVRGEPRGLGSSVVGMALILFMVCQSKRDTHIKVTLPMEVRKP